MTQAQVDINRLRQPLTQALVEVISKRCPFKTIEAKDLTVTLEEKPHWSLEKVNCIVASTLFHQIPFEIIVDPISGQFKTLNFRMVDLPKKLLEFIHSTTGVQTFIYRASLANGYFAVSVLCENKSYQFLSDQTGDKISFYNLQDKEIPSSDPIYQTMRDHAVQRIKKEWPFKEVDEAKLELKVCRRETTGMYFANSFKGYRSHESIEGAMVGWCKFNKESYRIDADPFGEHVKALELYHIGELGEKTLDYLKDHFGSEVRIIKTSLECYGREITIKIGDKEFYVFETNKGLSHTDQYPSYLSV